MYRIRRIISVALTALILLFCFVGCDGERNKSEKLSVVVTIFPQYDFVRQIAGDAVELTLLVPPGNEIHGFEPTVEDLAMIYDSDLFIYVGKTSERWVEKALSVSGVNTRTLAMTEVVDAVEEELVEGMEPEEEDGDAGEKDEHVWTSPKRAMVLCRSIADTLCELDPDNAELYTTRCEDYISELAALDERLTDVVGSAKRHTVVFAERFPFRYLAEDYGLEYFAAFAGCSTETEPSLATLAFLTSKINSEQIPVVFYIEFSKKTVAQSISSATGAKMLLLHSCQNVTAEEFDSGETYLSLMSRNIDNLEEALN